MLTYQSKYNDNKLLYLILFEFEACLSSIGLRVPVRYQRYAFGGDRCLMLYLDSAELFECPLPTYVRAALAPLKEEGCKISLVKLFDENKSIQRKVVLPEVRAVEQYVDSLLNFCAKTKILTLLAKIK